MTKISTWLPVWVSVIIFCLHANASQVNQCESVFAPRSSYATIMEKVAPWALGAATALTPWVALAKGGFSGSGGGEGVASFSNLEDARQARAYLEAGAPLPDSLLQRARIVPLERWELEQNGGRFFSFPLRAQWPELFKKAKDNVRLISPIVDRRLDQVADWMKSENWVSVDHLPYLGDAKPVKALGSLDVPVQLALRFSDGNSEKGKGPTRDPVRLKVIFNQKLFNRLSPIDQAMLVMHEQLYALSQAVGHQTSDGIRPLVQLFFSAHADDIRRRSHDGLWLLKITTFFKFKLFELVGDYTVFFTNADRSAHSTPYSADRHFSVFVEIVDEIRDKVAACVKGGRAKDSCAYQALDEFGLQEDLSGEKAFVFLTYFVLERHAAIFNAEAIMDGKRSRESYIEAMKSICAELENVSSDNQRIKIISPAMMYCRNFRL